MVGQRCKWMYTVVVALCFCVSFIGLLASHKGTDSMFTKTYGVSSSQVLYTFDCNQKSTDIYIKSTIFVDLMLQDTRGHMIPKSIKKNTTEWEWVRNEPVGTKVFVQTATETTITITVDITCHTSVVLSIFVTITVITAIMLGLLFAWIISPSSDYTSIRS